MSVEIWASSRSVSIIPELRGPLLPAARGQSVWDWKTSKGGDGIGVLSGAMAYLWHGELCDMILLDRIIDSRIYKTDIFQREGWGKK